MTESKKIINYSIENLKAGERKGLHFDFFQFEYFAKDIEHLKKSHRHEFHALIFVTAGTGSHVVDFVEYPIQANRCFYIGYGQVHAWKTLKHVRGYVILFTDDFYNAIYTGNKILKSDRLLSDLGIYVDIPNDAMLKWNNYFLEIEQEFNDKGQDWELVICLLLKALVLRYRKFSNIHNNSNETFKRRLIILNDYRDLVNKYFGTDKTPKNYAEKLFITPNYLNSICKEATGKSAGQFIRERVILEAKRLILHSKLTISEISHKLGFDDKSHFGKYFKNAVGIPPDKFRKDTLKKEESTTTNDL